MAGPAFRVAATAFWAGTSFPVTTLTIPSTVQVGDLMVLGVVSRDPNHNAILPDWTERAFADISIGSTGTATTGGAYVFTKIATASDPGSTISLGSAGTGAWQGSDSRWTMGLVAYSDAAVKNFTAGTPFYQSNSVMTPPQTADDAGQIFHGGYLRYGPFGASSTFISGTNMIERAYTALGTDGNNGGWESVAMGDFTTTGPGETNATMFTSSISSGSGVLPYSLLIGAASVEPPPPPQEHVDLPVRPPVTTSAHHVRRRGWRYFATRMNGDGTETLLDMDLPLEDVEIEDVLSGDQQLNAKIEPAYRRLIGPDGHPILTEWGTAIYAENNGDIRFGGILVSSGFEGPQWSLETIGYTGYARDLPYTGGGYKGIMVDPFDVVRVIWDHIQSQPGGDIGLVLDSTTTNGRVLIGSALAADDYDPEGSGIDGVSLETQAFKLNRYTNHDLAGDVDDLATQTPFDYHERHFWKDDGTIGHHLDFGYESIGRKRTDLRFVLGVNIFEPPSVDKDGSIYASGSLVLGAGTGSAAKWALRERAQRPQGRLRRIAVVVDDTLKTNKRCAARAETENQWRAQMDDIESFVVIDHPNARLGEARVGDVIRIDARGDWDSWSMEVRITAITYKPGDGGQAQYTVARTDKLSS